MDNLTAHSYPFAVNLHCLVYGDSECSGWEILAQVNLFPDRPAGHFQDSTLKAAVEVPAVSNHVKLPPQ